MACDWENLATHYAARLLPNPRGTPEARASSALLSMIRGVSEFGNRFSKRAGGPKYKQMHRYVECMTEVPREVLAGECEPGKANRKAPATPARKRDYGRFDGVIVIRKGKSEWKALVEIKVGR